MAKSAEEMRMPCRGDGRMGERDRIKLGSENEKKKIRVLLTFHLFGLPGEVVLPNDKKTASAPKMNLLSK
jgi:hypothetical protein